eukprot:TRINITY_DN2374_c0_g1_i1.p1 TRINITY_DN2374_c0_g1~~TRINITY_DN2374_c0_g1_i1.p1  ORF type:complete len:338 (+),score=17.99 TRINITY_DN2374_c0_g1_i1:104-1015(+)
MVRKASVSQSQPVPATELDLALYQHDPARDSEFVSVITTSDWTPTQVDPLRIRTKWGQQFSSLATPAKKDSLPEDVQHFIASQITLDQLSDQNFQFTEKVGTDPKELKRLWVKMGEVGQGQKSKDEYRVDDFVRQLLEFLGFNDFPFSIQRVPGTIKLGPLLIASEVDLQIYNIQSGLLCVRVEDKPSAIAGTIHQIIGEALAMVQYQFHHKFAKGLESQDENQELTGAVLRFHGTRLAFAELKMKAKVVNQLREGDKPSEDSFLLVTSAKGDEGSGPDLGEPFEREEAVTQLVGFINKHMAH